MDGKAIKKIGLLTSGGDGPGMNAAIRSVVRCALYHKLSVAGIIRGYQGLIDDDVIDMNHRSVSNIINQGGTILKTARCEEFRTEEGQAKAIKTLKQHQIDALIVIGGDGSYKGAVELYEKFGFPVIGLPGTIDNDLYGTDQTIGCMTAVNTALESIDKIRDTVQSMERIFVIEVMGNKSGFIALEVALGGGAEDVIIPEKPANYEVLCKRIRDGHKIGKNSWIIITAEGAAKAADVAKTITMMTKLETRYVVLGHVQRGGIPTASDRILGTRLGAAAVDLLRKGISGKAVGVLQDNINVVDLKEARKVECSRVKEYLDLIRILT